MHNEILDPPRVLTVGLPDAIHQTVKDLLASTRVTAVPLDFDSMVNDAEKIRSELNPCLVISGEGTDRKESNEAAQALRMLYPDLPSFFCSQRRQGFERKELVENGFNDAFLLPLDLSVFRGKISEVLATVTNGLIRILRPVKIFDIDSERALDFEVNMFMPVNRKYLKLVNAGDALDSTRLEKLKKHQVSNLFVPAEQMQRFYQYSANRLRELNTGSKFGATERQEKLTQAVRDIISGLFTDDAATFQDGQEMLRDVGEIVKTFIIDGADGEWFERIQQVLSEQGGAYLHSGNVSTLAALFSMGLGVGKPQDLALAGLLHDIGQAELPLDIQNLTLNQMNPEQKKLFESHPDLSVHLIRSRKISVSDSVTKAIQQHHELFNGEGFPRGLFGDRVSKEAQVLALANAFDEMTSMKPGRPALNPQQAVVELRKLQVDNPAKIHYHPELLRRLLDLFPR